jgi:hypothetical protein
MSKETVEDIGLRNLGALAKKIAGKFDKELDEFKKEAEELLDDIYLREDDLRKTLEKDVTIPIQNMLGMNYKEGKYSVGKPFLTYLKRKLAETEEDLRDRIDL